MKSDNSIIIVQGAQYGSESKGSTAHAIALREKVTHAVRTGSINAGHNVILETGEKFAFQQLPTACIISGVTSVIGPGAYVNDATLQRELKHARYNVIIDNNCGVHLDDYTAEAKNAKRNLKIGATGKGCAEAIIHKIKDRGVKGQEILLYKNFHIPDERVKFSDTVELLTDVYHNRHDKIMIEGTQGTLLDFHCGPYPYVTSRQTIASAWVTEAGLSPSLKYEVVLVARTYPIRVAGNSGPMPYEITWPKLTRRINTRLKEKGFPLIVKEESIQEFEQLLNKANQKNREGSEDPDSERSLVANTEAILEMSEEGRTDLLKFFEITTVTKRLRRIAEMDVIQLQSTIRKENPSYLVLTFLNYVFPELVYTRNLDREMLLYLEDLQDRLRCWIRYVTIGPKANDMIETPLYFQGRSLGKPRY